MLINLNSHLSVAKHHTQSNEQWICYEALSGMQSQKRQAWKKVTGLMSTQNMHSWLSKSYPESNHAGNFLTISNR